MAAKTFARIYTQYDLRATLESGQTFAFCKDEIGFFGIVDKKFAEIAKIGDGYNIHCHEADADFWRRYFDLDRSYGNLLQNFIFDDLSQNSGVRSSNQQDGGKYFLTLCVNAFSGLRLLRQPVWETICAFIISANNHQKRIESIYRRISGYMGDETAWEGRIYHAFPSARKLAGASVDELRSLGLGYRAPYLLDTAKKIAATGLPDLDNLGYEEALKFLTGLRGVGEKVADCVLLFATGHQKAFPVDVWIERAMRDYYGMSGSRHKIKQEAQALFGDAAGIAQQFIFHGMRTRLTPGPRGAI